MQEPLYTQPQPVATHPPQTRADFMKGVYAHLMGGILAFIAVSWVLHRAGLDIEIYRAVMNTSWLLILGGFMLVSWIANSMGVRARTPGAQYGGYALLVVANAVLFTIPFVHARIVALDNGLDDGEIIRNAAYLTIFAFVGLSIIAIRTGKDFSFLRGILLWGGVMALVAIVGSVLLGANLGLWFTLGMIAFAGAAILYDTQKVYRAYPPDMVVPAAMSLFASIALLFWYVLQLLSRR